MMKYYSQQLNTPDGIFSFIVQGHDVLASGWTADINVLKDRIKLSEDTIETEIPEVVSAVEAYYEGALVEINQIPLRYKTEGFIGKALSEMRKISAGTTLTYTQLAAKAGNEKAFRAAASACARNNVALFIPCHRVLRSNGTLGGFLWGLEVKESLLEHELFSRQKADK